MSSASMYGEHAEYYDAIYHWKDYPREVERLRAILAQEGVPEGAQLLEAACGTGSHLLLLAPHYRVSGFDLNPSMLAVARRKLPTTPLFVADMADPTALPEAGADVLLCLFSSIGYLFPEARLRSAAQAFAAALRPGGVLLVEPWLTERNFREGNPSLQTYDSPELKLARATIARRDGALSVLDMHWLVAKKGRPEVEHFVDHHALWMCPTETMLGVFREVGFEVRYDPDGLMKDRGLIIGRRR